MNIKDLSAKGSACLREKYRSAVIQLLAIALMRKNGDVTVSNIKETKISSSLFKEAALFYGKAYIAV